MDYDSGIGLPNTVQNRATRSFLGVHRYASSVAIQGDVGWKWSVVRSKVEIVKLLRYFQYQITG